MTTRSTVWALLLIASVLLPSAAFGLLEAGDSVVVDFNAAADIDNFTLIRDDNPSLANLGIGHNAAKGIGTPASGALEVINVGTSNTENDLASLYAPHGVATNTHHLRLLPGETLTLILKFKTLHVDEAATPRLGIASAADVNAATTDGTVLEINGGKDIIGGTTDNNWASGIAVNIATGGDKSFNIVDVIGGGVRDMDPDPNGPYVLTDDTWYRFVADITKSLTMDVFDVSAVLELLNADGTSVSAEIGSHSRTITNALLYADDVIAGFTMVHDPEPDTVSNEYDDFSLQIMAPVPSAPEIMEHPQDQTAVLGGDAAWSVTSSGTVPLGYQWTLDAVPLAGATNRSLVVTNAGEDVAGPYACTVTNALGSATSSNAFLQYIGPALMPVDQVVFGLNPIVITPAVPDGPGRTYTWRKDGATLAGQTDRVLSIASASPSDAGTYDLVYSLGGNTVTSDAAGVVVPPPPTEAYATIVTGDMPRAYWRLGEVFGAATAEEEIAFVVAGGLDGNYLSNAVAGEAGALLGDPDAAMRCAGDINSMVEVPGGSDTVDTLGDWNGSAIPFSVEVWALAEGGAGTFRSPFTYLDYVNATDIYGWTLLANSNNRWDFRTGEGLVNSPDTDAFNTIEGPAVEIGKWTHLVGTYDGTDLKLFVDGVQVGMVTNAAYAPPDSWSPFDLPCLIGGGSPRSPTAPVGSRGDPWNGKVDEAAYYGHALTANEVLEHYAAAFPLDTPPVIDVQPEDTVVLEGVEASFFVAANSTTPMSYAWRKDGSPVAGGTNQTLTLVATTGDAGSYDVIVHNAGGGSVTSEVATLTVYAEVAGTPVSVNFAGYVLGGANASNLLIELNGGVAGFVATNGWNEIGQDQGNNVDPQGGILDVRGVDTGITLTWASENNRWGRIDPVADADQAMYNGGLESRDSSNSVATAAMVTLSNIPPQYTSIGYDVIVYLGGPGGALSNRYHDVHPSFYGEITDGSTAYYFHTRDANLWDANFVAATETDPNVPTNGLADANLAIFAGLTAPTLTLTADVHPVIGEGPAQISGFQIVPGRTTPTIPLSIGLAAGEVVIDWAGGGVLQNATDLPLENWTDVDGGAVTNGPYVVPAPTPPAESFRLREP